MSDLNPLHDDYEAVVRERDYYRALQQRQAAEHKIALAQMATVEQELQAENARLAQRIETLEHEMNSRKGSQRDERAVPSALSSLSDNQTDQPNRPPLKQRLRRTVRMTGRWAINALPISATRKIGLKRAILRYAAPFFGLPPQQVSAGVIDPALFERGTPERCRLLAATARGIAINVPERSVSIIVPVYNQIAYTLACIESVHTHSKDIDYEIIVVDDASSDDTKTVLSARDDIIYVRNRDNLGFIGSCNAGAKRATRNYLCFLNNDTKVTAGWLSALVNTFELHENVGLAGSKLVYPNGQLQEAGGLIWNDGSGWNWGRLQDPSDPRYNYARRADYCSGAAIVVPRMLFKSLGGFDKRYTPAYGEDSDLAFKVRSLGLATVYQPLSEVVHFEGITSGTDTSKGVKKHQVVNAERLAERWAPVLAHQGENGVDAHLAVDRGCVGRILVLDQITPEPDRDAGSITALELMRALRDLGYKVTFAPVSNWAFIKDYTDLLSGLGIESLLLPWAGSFKSHLQAFGAHYDAVLIFRPPTWFDHIEVLRKYAPQAKLIYHSSDLHFLREERERQLSGFEADKTFDQSGRQAELELFGRADLCIVHSSTERDLLREFQPSCKVACFPWIYEARGTGAKFSERHGIIFLGGYAHAPNVDAVDHYMESIHPLVAPHLSDDGAFVIAGSKPPERFQEFAGPRVKVTGYIEDVSETLFSTRVMVVPLRYGAGIKGKILTAMAHGVPVVTTSVGAEGMELVDGEHALVADAPEEFAAMTLRLYRDEALWSKLQSAGLAYVERMTSRAAGLKTVAGLLADVGLPSLDRSSPSMAVGHATAFGSHPSLTDIALLNAAGERQIGRRADLTIVPDGVTAEAKSALPSAIEIGALDAGRAAYVGKAIVAVVDQGDHGSIKQLAKRLAPLAVGKTEIAVVFAPARLLQRGSRYHVAKAFSEDGADGIQKPVHEAWGDAFAFPGTMTEWAVDTKLTGFPSIFIVKIRARSEAAEVA